MKTLKRKGKKCEYIKINFNDEAEYKAILDCLNRSSVLIGESFPEDTDGSNFELVKMLESTKMSYEDGTVSALIFFDFVEQLFWHCWDLSVLTCKHANLYQLDAPDAIEPATPAETVIEQPESEEPAIEKVVEPSVEEDVEYQPAVKDENIDSEPVVEPVDEIDPPTPEITTSIEIETVENTSEPVDEEEAIEEPSAPILPTVDIDIEDVDVEAIKVEESVDKKPPVEETNDNESDIKEHDEEETTIEEEFEFEEKFTDEEPTMYEPSIDESFLEGIALEEPPVEEPTIEEPVIEEPVVNEKEVERATPKTKKKKTIELVEDADAQAAALFAKMTGGDTEETEKKTTNKFMQRVNKFFKK